MAMNVLEISTPDGTCRTALFGQGPGVILIQDAGGPRNALFGMAEQMAAAGFCVAVPDLMYRVGNPFDLLPHGTPHDAGLFLQSMRNDPEFRKQLTEKYVKSANSPENVKRDFTAILSALKQHCAPGRVRVTGYCMGGGIALRAAGLFPDDICAAASFHGGYLAHPGPDSPHLSLPNARAEIFVAGAQEDPSFPDEMKTRLEETLKSTKLTWRVETWPGRHGFAVTDFPVFDAALGKRHLDELIALFKRTS
ncbi:MAG: dienelactone hydrolase family protein [Archangium sp.]